MPVLRDNIKETELKFFETYFLKLDFQCKKKSESTVPRLFVKCSDEIAMYVYLFSGRLREGR